MLLLDSFSLTVLLPIKAGVIFSYGNQIYEESSMICLSSMELQRHIGTGLRATFGPPNVSRVQLASFTHFSGRPPRKHLIVQFTISSPKSLSSALITATAKWKKNSFVLDRIDANLSNGRKLKVFSSKNKSRFGF